MPDSTSITDSTPKVASGPVDSNATEKPPAETVTERGWDGWPTPPTPEYLQPGMGKVPVSSTTHFQTVAMTAMGSDVSGAQLKELQASLLRWSQPGRRWHVDKSGKVRVKSEAVPAAPAFDATEEETREMVEKFRRRNLDRWTENWLMDASQSDRDQYDEAMRAVREAEAAVGESKESVKHLEQAIRSLILLMEQLRTERDHVRHIREVHEREVREAIPKVFTPAIDSFAALVTRLEETGLQASDIIRLDEELFTVQQALNALFNIFDEGPMDPLFHARVDAMVEPAEGVILYHEQGWYSRGLALGNLLHSTALAPGEVTQVAMTHWNHSTRATDSESLSQTDRTAARDVQDRAVSEVQDAVSNEHTAGGSTGVSLGMSMEGGYAGFGVSVSGGAASNFSTVVTHSDGSKNLSMEANQHIAASTQRHAEAARTRRASVVREITQSEDENLSTRVLANYNHMHAMTVMYFEVVEVYDLKTRVVDADRVIFLPFKVREIHELIPRYRGVLIRAAHAAGRPELADAIVHYQTDHTLLESEKTEVIQEIQEATSKLTTLESILQGRSTNSSETAAAERIPTQSATARGAVEKKIGDLTKQRAEVMAAFQAAPEFLGKLAAQAVQAQWRSLDEQIEQLHAQLQELILSEERVYAQLTRERKSLQTFLASRKARKNQIERALSLLKNLGEKTESPGRPDPFLDLRLYFNQAVWLSLSSGEVLELARRRYMFKGDMLCQHIDPRPVAITGNYVAYRWRFDDVTKTQAFKKLYVETFTGDPDRELASVSNTLAIPTGGVFGEAVLGQGVSAEKIDLSRFWNWKDSMIPILPTSINPLNAASPALQNISTEPGRLDASSAKLDNLQDLPAPSGFNALAETMRTQIFRDMSGQTMLQSLAEATTKAAASGAEEAGKRASENFKEGLQFTKDMAPLVMEALAAPETGGASLLAGKLNASEGGGTSLLGGMLNARSPGDNKELLSQLIGEKKSGISKSVGDAILKTGSGGGGQSSVPGKSQIPEQELEEVDPEAKIP